MCSIYYRPPDTLKMTKLTPSIAILKRAYSQIWHSTPFTAMDIIQFSLKKTDMSAEDWVGATPIDITKPEGQLETVVEFLDLSVLTDISFECEPGPESVYSDVTC